MPGPPEPSHSLSQVAVVAGADAMRLNRGPEDRGGPRTKLVGNLGNTGEA